MPFCPRVNNISVVGCRIPRMMPFATERPAPPVEFDSSALEDHAARMTAARTASKVAIHLLGSFESVSAGVSFISSMNTSRQFLPEP